MQGGKPGAVFNNVEDRDPNSSEAKIIFIEHVTRELLWQQKWMEHPNGALSTRRVALCVEDVDSVSENTHGFLTLNPLSR